MVLPRWSRVLEKLSHAAQMAHQAQQVVTSEVLLGFLPEQQRSEFTFLAYSKMSSYLPGGETFEGGLAPWELRLLEHPEVPRHGRVLLAGAGGGRELSALAARGYHVYAFEPTAALLAGARAVASRSAGSVCVLGSYADMTLAVDGRGPLASAPAPFDLVYFGWGSFTHVTRPSEQLAILSAARALGPRAPLLLSFWLRRPVADSKTERFRRRVRSVLGHLGAVRPLDGVIFHHGPGFAYQFTPAELEELARRAGYRVALLSDEGFPHALLVPVAASDGS